MSSKSDVVGDNLKRIRNEKKLSLTQASKITGVSKSMLSAIENHRKSPTISLLSTIAEKLEVSLIELILERSDTDDVDVLVRDSSNVVHVSTDFYSTLMFGANTNHKFSVYKYVLPPFVKRPSSEAHGSTWEYCLVLKGTLYLTVSEKQYKVREREMVWFPTFLKHIYENRSSKSVEFIMFTFFD